MERIKFTVATNQKLKKEAYKLRYNVFTLENNILRYADKKSQIYQDNWDLFPESLLFVGLNHKGQVIATFRTFPRKIAPYFADEVFGYKWLAKNLRLSYEEVLRTGAHVGRYAVDKNYRGLGIGSHLMRFCEYLSYTRGIRIFFSITKVSYLRMLNLLQKTGYKCFPNTVAFQEHVWQCVYKQLENGDRVSNQLEVGVK